MEETYKKISKLTDATHIFYTTWMKNLIEVESVKANLIMFKTVLEAVSLNASNLRHIYLTTGTKHCVGPSEAVGKITPNESPFTQDLPRLNYQTFYYPQEDYLFKAVKQKKGLTCSIHQPTTVFGFSLLNHTNMINALCAYANICKYKRTPFKSLKANKYMKVFFDASDDDLNVEQEIWAIMDANAKSEAFKSQWRCVPVETYVEVLGIPIWCQGPRI